MEKSVKKATPKKSVNTKKNVIATKSNTTKKTIQTKPKTTSKNITTSPRKVTSKSVNTSQKIKKTAVNKKVQVAEVTKEIQKEPILVKNKAQKREVKDNKLLKILSALIISLLLVFTITKTYPSIKEKNEIKNLRKEINELIDKDQINQEELQKENITSGDLLIVENKIEVYLEKFIGLKKEYDDIKNNEKIKDIINIENSEYEEYQEKLSDLKEKVKALKENNKNDIENKEYADLYNELCEEIEKSMKIEDIDTLIDYLNIREPAIKYLNSNKDKYSIEDNTIVFKKRKNKEEFDKLVKDIDDIKEYKLVDDKTAPVITASDQTIYKNDKLNLSSKIKCVDEVDDEVECTINGSFNSSITGEYKITISSKDKSNNESKKEIKVIVKEKTTTTKSTTTTTDSRTVSSKPYYIEVIRNQNIVIIYGKGSDNKYSKVVKVFVASTGKNNKTPLGTYKTTRGDTWGWLVGGVAGQYITRFYGSYLFHSVPYYTNNKGKLEWEEYNKLGTQASAGCVRLTVRDAKWIYDNISNGTTVKIYDGPIPAGITKPTAQKIPANSPNRGWDPTDPDKNNPWNK